MKLHAALIECDMSYLLKEPCTTVENGLHSKILMLELFKKLQGSALALFISMNAQMFYMEGGRGIEMLHALVNKFHRLDNRAIQNIINSMQTLQLQDYKDLSVYRDKLENFNLQLSLVGQKMSSSFLIFLAQSQLAKSRYKKDIEALQLSHTASGTSFIFLDDLCHGLERLDELRSLPYGGKAISLPPTSGLQNKHATKHIPTKNSFNVGIVAAVQDTDDVQVFEMHKESWVGAINLDEAHARQLRQMFKSVQCCSNNHTLPHCPLMKNWSIQKKPRSDKEGGTSQQNTSLGVSNQSLHPLILLRIKFL